MKVALISNNKFVLENDRIVQLINGIMYKSISLYNTDRKNTILQIFALLYNEVQSLISYKTISNKDELIKLLNIDESKYSKVTTDICTYLSKHNIELVHMKYITDGCRNFEDVNLLASQLVSIDEDNPICVENDAVIFATNRNDNNVDINPNMISKIIFKSYVSKGIMIVNNVPHVFYYQGNPINFLQTMTITVENNNNINNILNDRSLTFLEKTYNYKGAELLVYTISKVIEDSVFPLLKFMDCNGFITFVTVQNNKSISMKLFDKINKSIEKN